MGNGKHGSLNAVAALSVAAGTRLLASVVQTKLLAERAAVAEASPQKLKGRAG
jgi:hypothetical protein